MQLEFSLDQRQETEETCSRTIVPADRLLAPHVSSYAAMQTRTVAFVSVQNRTEQQMKGQTTDWCIGPITNPSQIFSGVLCFSCLATFLSIYSFTSHKTTTDPVHVQGFCINELKRSLGSCDEICTKV